ncbi:MAG: hypothetical protein WCG85_28105 [Polyangia bacterium]
MALAAGACGKGLFTIPLVVTTGDSGLQADEAAPPGDDGSPAADARSDLRVSPDGAVDGPADLMGPDSAPDGLGPGASVTQPLDFPGGDVTLGDATVGATLIVPRGAFAQQTNVTLSLITLALPNDDAGLAAPGGAVGPVFSLNKTDTQGRDATLQTTATLALTFSLADTSIPAQRVKLAYFDTQSNPNLWIAIVTSSYNPTARVLTGDVFEFTGTRLFAPVESCLTGQACPRVETCQGGACQ